VFGGVGEKVAELARLPWVFQRAALNPARVARRVRKACSEVSAVGPMAQSEEYLGHPGEPASQP